MPKRPRSHALETESRQAIERALPSAWIYRSQSPDYSIDASVEIVSPEGAVTGHIFNVQLKATDAKSMTRGLRVVLKRSTAEYYAKLAIPVLIVRYHAPTKTLYARWFHDMRVPKRTGRAKSKVPLSKNSVVTLRLEETDKWNPDTNDDLAKAVALWRWIKSPSLDLPIRLQLIMETSEVAGHSATAVAREAEAMARRVADVLDISEVPTRPVHGTIRVGREQTEIHLPAGSGLAIKKQQGVIAVPSASELAADILVAISVALEGAGHALPAARIIGSAAADSTLIRSVRGITSVSNLLAQVKQFATLLELASTLVERGVEVGRAQHLVLPVAFGRDRIPSDAADAVQIGLERWVTTVSRHAGPVEVAVAHYNVGRSYGPWPHTATIALEHFREALHADPAYASRYYFWVEIGTLLARSGHFRFAIGAYTRALELGAPAEYRARLADVLLHAGEYDQASEQFARYVREIDKVQPHWALKAATVSEIARAAGVGSQRRERNIAQRIASEGSTPADPQATASACSLALRSDALCADAWYNLGGAQYLLGDSAEAMTSFLVAALQRPDDVEPWANAAALAIGLEEQYSDLTTTILAAAFYIHGADFYRTLLDIGSANSSAAERQELAEALQAMLQSLPPAPVDSGVRVIQPDGSVRYMSFDEYFTEYFRSD